MSNGPAADFEVVPVCTFTPATALNSTRNAARLIHLSRDNVGKVSHSVTLLLKVVEPPAEAESRRYMMNLVTALIHMT